LLELEQQGTVSLETQSRGSGTEFIAALEKRDAIVEELARVTYALAHERAHFGGGSHEERREVQALMVRLWGISQT
jgi:hypothetical protein